MAAPTGAMSVQRRVSARRAESVRDETDRRAPDDLTPTAPSWLIGALAALQAALWSYGLIIVPAVAAFVGAAAHVTTEATWSSAVSVGTALWVLGHGGPVHVSGGVISIVPLGLSLVAFLACRSSAHRASRRSIGTLIGFVGSYIVLLTGVALAIDAGVVQVMVGAGLIGTLGAASGMVRGDRAETVAALPTKKSRGRSAAATAPVLPMRSELVQWRARVTGNLPSWATPSLAVRRGAQGAVAFCASLIALAAVITTVWAVAGRSASSDILASLGLDTTGGLVLAAGQTTLVPNMILWAVAWLSGAGFAVGSASVFTPGAATLGALPALPILGGLPTGGMAGSTMRWAPVLVAAVALVVGLWLWRRLRADAGTAEVPWVSVGSAFLSLVLVVGVLTGFALLFASGSGGPGALAEVGAEAVPVARRLAGFAAAGTALVVLVAHPAPRRRVRLWLVEGWRYLFGLVTGKTNHAG